MFRDACIRLEFDKVLGEIARHAHSEVTCARLQAMAPLADGAAIRLTAARVEELRGLDRLGIRLGLAPFADVRPLLEQLRPAGAFLAPHELLLFIPLLRMSADISRQLAPRTDVPLIKGIEPPLSPFPEILEPLEASIDHDATIMDSASTLLRETRRAKRALAGRIRKKIEEIVRDSGIEIFLQDDFITQRSGRWVIPVRMDSKGMVKGVVHDVSASGETAFMEPLEIIPFVNELENLAADEKAEEIRILRQLSAWIREDAPRIAACFGTLVELDRLASIACWAEEFGLTSPDVNDQGELRLNAARHPLLLFQQRQGTLSHIEPLDLVLGTGTPVMVITGPNAGGKTIALKTAGMLSLMALCGLPIPAGERSTVPLFDALLVDIGDDQSIAQSLSTFSAHVARVCAILERAGTRSLILLDELGAGTEPLQGAAIACGVLSELQQRGAMVIATTHLTDIIGFVHRTPGMVNAGMEYDDQSFTPLYRLVVGEPGQSHAVEIARRFGMPEGVIAFARRMLGSAGSEFATLLTELRQRRRELEEARSGLDEREHRLAQRAAALEDRAAEVERIRREAAEKGWSEARELISTSRRRMNELLEEYKRERRSEVIDKLRKNEQALADRLKPLPEEERLVPLSRVVVGDRVHVRSLGHGGTVVQLMERQGKARIQAGRMEVDVPLAELFAPLSKGAEKQRPAATGHWQVTSVENDAQELKLIGQRVDEALDALETFLNQALLAGRREVRIIHGIGSGRLRQAVREQLERHPLVALYRPGEPHEGRDGATVVTLKQ